MISSRSSGNLLVGAIFAIKTCPFNSFAYKVKYGGDTVTLLLNDLLYRDSSVQDI